MSRRPHAPPTAPTEVFSKQYMSPPQLLAHLGSRGLVVHDPADAQRKLELIGYHRLRIYFLARRDTSRPGKPFMSRYKAPLLPPIWTMKELMTFGASVIFLRSLAQPLRNQVSQAFGIHDPEVFDSWIDCMVDLRNICAHHARLFNRSFQKQPKKLIREMSRQRLQTMARRDSRRCWSAWTS